MISFLSRSFAAMPHWIPRRCWIYPPGPQGDEEMSAECWVNNWKPKSARNKQKSSKILVGYTVVDSGTSAKCKIETPNVWQKRWKTNNTISQHKFGYESLLAHKHLTPKTRHLKTFNFQVALAVTFRDYVARLTAARIDPRSFTLKSFSAHWEKNDDVSCGSPRKNTNKNTLFHVEKQKHSPPPKKQIYKGWKLKMEGILHGFEFPFSKRIMFSFPGAAGWWNFHASDSSPTSRPSGSKTSLSGPQGFKIQSSFRDVSFSPKMVDWDSLSSCWTLGREAGIVDLIYRKQPYHVDWNRIASFQI